MYNDEAGMYITYFSSRVLISPIGKTVVAIAPDIRVVDILDGAFLH